MRYTNIGSVIHGTMRDNDVIPALLRELEKYDGEYADKLYEAVRTDLYESWTRDVELGDVDLGDIIEELFDALNEHAPPYFFFGAHPGDGADFGYWLSEEFQEQFREGAGIEVNDTSEVPKGFSGEVLHINDHGNATLYVADSKGNLEEIWTVV